MQLFKAQAGIISENPCWIIIDGSYMYIADSYHGVIQQWLFEYKDDKHLVG